MKKSSLAPLFILAFIVSSIFTNPTLAAAATTKTTWRPTTPDGYTAITWAKAPGVASFFKAPDGNGSLDFLTKIYLPQNQIEFITSSSTPLDWGLASPDFISNLITANLTNSNTTTSELLASSTTTTAANDFHNFAFLRTVAETNKQIAPGAKFIWSAPFFNVTLPTTDLSFALKSLVGTTTLITSGSRPIADLAEERRMLIINNQTGQALIENFNSATFIDAKTGDQALEGFAPTVTRNEGTSVATARLFLGVSANNSELLIYCSQQATIQEASAALTAAGIPPEHQLQADGGGSATCGYNLPGQFFVEPVRTLPLMMGAITILSRGTANTNDLNVRRGPATKYSIVTKLAKGTAVRVFEEKNGWYRIGINQWVSKALIKKS
ncbi:MAG: SH3 domain-containing protein [Candidatus Buchananbacteria bacterium]